MPVRAVFVCGALALVCLPGLSAQTNQPPAYLSYAQAAPVYAALGAAVPTAGEWPAAIARADAATRARVAQGDETSIVHLLLFGTSFTSQPRITSRQLSEGQIQDALDVRLRDFERALAKPDVNARFQFARRMLPGAPATRPRLLSLIDRTVKEEALHARWTADAHALGDPSLEFAERSRLFRERGLASDTSVRVNFAIEEALRSLTPKLEVRRVAVIGPGLDVVDKQEGYDFYPEQTIQPFAIVDSVVRLGLADADTIRVTTFDISSRVNDHIVDLARRARSGVPYEIHIPLDGAVEWTPDMLGYFERFGAAVGDSLPVTIPPGIGPLRLRAVAVRPSVAGRISARDINVTAQVLPLADAERFDLVVGTNVFLYYDRLQQGLAMTSVAAMLRPGGLLLSNNALVEAPSAGMRAIGYSRTLYSNRDEDGDVIIWYQKESQ